MVMVKILRDIKPFYIVAQERWVCFNWRLFDNNHFAVSATLVEVSVLKITDSNHRR